MTVAFPCHTNLLFDIDNKNHVINTCLGLKVEVMIKKIT